MIKYKISVLAWVRQMLPWYLRGATQHERWLYVLLTPLRTLNATVRYDAKRLRRQAVQCAQVMTLETILNDEFDPALRRIEIVDGAGPAAFVVEVPIAMGLAGAPLAKFNRRIEVIRPAGTSYTLSYVI